MNKRIRKKKRKQLEAKREQFQDFFSATVRRYMAFAKEHCVTDVYEGPPNAVGLASTITVVTRLKKQ